MESVYNKFFGKDHFFQNKTQKIYPMTLSRTDSMPLLSSYNAKKLPYSLSGTIPYKKREQERNSSDLRLQILEERLKNTGNANKKYIPNNHLFNPSNNYTKLPLIHLSQNQNSSATTINNVKP